MKVIVPGVFIFTGGSLIVQNWAIDTEGEKFSDPEAEKRAVVFTALQFIGARYDIRILAGESVCDPVDPTEHAPAEVERLTQDVIAACRWREQGLL